MISNCGQNRISVRNFFESEHERETASSIFVRAQRFSRIARHAAKGG